MIIDTLAGSRLRRGSLASLLQGKPKHFHFLQQIILHYIFWIIFDYFLCIFYDYFFWTIFDYFFWSRQILRLDWPKKFRQLVVHLLLPGAQVELALGDGEGEEGGQGEDDQPGGDRVSHSYSVLFNQMWYKGCPKRSDFRNWPKPSFSLSMTSPRALTKKLG